MPEKETILLTEDEKEEYLDLVDLLQNASSPGEALQYKKQLEGLIQKGKVRASIERRDDISKTKVAKKLLATSKLSTAEIAIIVELPEAEIMFLQKDGR